MGVQKELSFASTKTKIKIASDKPFNNGEINKLIQKSTKAFLDGDFQSAVNIFTSLLKNPENLDQGALDNTYKNLAISYEKLGKKSDARRVWQSHFKFDFEPYLLYQEGTQDLLNNKFDKAIAKLTEALQGKIEKNLQKAVYNNLLVAHQKLGTKPIQMAVWQKAIDNELDGTANPFIQLALYYRDFARSKINEFTATRIFSVNNTVIAVPQALNLTNLGIATIQNGLSIYPNDLDLKSVGLELQIMQKLYGFDYVGAVSIAKKATNMFPTQAYFNTSLIYAQEVGCAHNVSKIVLDPISDQSNFKLIPQQNLPKDFCNPINITGLKNQLALEFADQSSVISISNDKPSKIKARMVDEDVLSQKIQIQNKNLPPFGSYSAALNAGATSFVFAFFTAMYMRASEQKSAKAMRMFHFAMSAFFLLLLGLSLKDNFVETLVSFILQSGVAAFAKILANSNYGAERFNNIAGTTLNISRDAMYRFYNDADGLKLMLSVAFSCAGSFAGDSFARLLDRTFFSSAKVNQELIASKPDFIATPKQLYKAKTAKLN